MSELAWLKQRNDQHSEGQASCRGICGTLRQPLRAGEGRRQASRQEDEGQSFSRFFLGEAGAWPSHDHTMYVAGTLR